MTEGHHQEWSLQLILTHHGGKLNILVLISIDIATMMFVMRLFLCLMCHIIEVINVHTWWGPTLRIGVEITLNPQPKTV